MHILITGATGGIGRYLVSYLMSNTNHSVLTVNRSVEKARSVLGEENERLAHSTIDFRDEILKFEPSVIIHLASYVTNKDDLESGIQLVESNILFGLRLLELTREINTLELFLNFGTFAEFKSGKEKIDNAYLYSASKTAFRVFTDFYSSILNYTILNLIPFTVYGTNDESKKLFDFILDGFIGRDMVKFSPGEQKLDFIHVHDICRIIEKLMETPQVKKLSTKTIDLGTGVTHTPQQVAEIMGRKLNMQSKHVWGALEYRKRDVMYACADISILNNFNCTPVINLEKGVDDYLTERGYIQ